MMKTQDPVCKLRKSTICGGTLYEWQCTCPEFIADPKKACVHIQTDMRKHFGKHKEE